MLRKLFEKWEDPAVPPTVDVVVIPAAGLSKPSEWEDHSGPWLKILNETVVPQARMWEFIYGPESGTFSSRLLEEGNRLLESLFAHCSQSNNEKCPVILISHGTGGFVLKKALCIAREQHYHYRNVIDVISGAIFLGSPHLIADITHAKSTIDLLLKCRNKGIGRSQASGNDVEALIDVCKAFERVNLNVPVVSAYESKGTPMQRNVFAKFLKKSSPIVVSDSVCDMKGNDEKIIDGEANHFEICRVRINSPLYNAIVALFLHVVEHAPKAIAETFKPYSVPLPFRNDTLRSPSTIGQSRVFEEEQCPRSSLKISSPRGATDGSTGAASFELVPAIAGFEITTKGKDPRLPCFSMGANRQMDQFLGRQEVLSAIDRVLLPSATSADGELSGILRSFALCGLGGMGKTGVAVQYAYTRRKQFEAIFWVSAANANILARDFAEIAQQLGLEDAPKDISASRALVHEWLARPVRKHAEPYSAANKADWLLILDNVDDLEVLSGYWPKARQGSVLITSRDPLAKKHYLYADDGMDIPPLSNQDSKALIQKSTMIRADGSEMDALTAIADSLGGLPLAIAQMAGVMRQLRMSYSAFLKVYKDKGFEEIQNMHKPGVDSDKARSLATVWALDNLTLETKSLLEVICLLDPDFIPEEVLYENCADVQLENYPKDLYSYYAARADLLQTSLISQNMDLEQLSLHRLIQDTTKANMSRDHLLKALQAALSLVNSAWPHQSIEEHHSIQRFNKCKRMFPCVQRLKDGLEPFVLGPGSFPFRIEVAKLLNDAGWYLFELGQPGDLKAFCDLALAIGNNCINGTHEECEKAVRESHAFLGIAAVEINDHTTSMFHKQRWLDMLLERQSEPGITITDYELGYAYNEIGVAYANEERFEEAAAAFKRSIEIFQGLQDYKDTMLGWPQPNLGFVYWMQGQLDEAEEVLVEILDIHAAAWGEDDTKSFKTGKILYALGNVLEAQGRFNESVKFHQRCLLQYKTTLGDAHHRVGDVCCRLANHCMRQEAYVQAETYLNQAMRIFEATPYLINELARSTFLESQLLRHMGNAQKADAALEDAFKLRKNVIPTDSRPLSQLGKKDFDSLVAFWSR